MLLAAAFIVANQFNGFEDIGAGSIIVTVLAAAFCVQCVASKSFAPLPIPVAVLYIVFQTTLHESYDLPKMEPWVLILAAIFAAIGLAVLLPGKRKHFSCGKIHLGRDWDTKTCDDNNIVINANFTGVSRYIHADALETARLSCSFGAIEVYFDQAALHPNGAEVICDCKFGAIVITVPKNWCVVDKINCTLGGVDHDVRRSAVSEGSPRLTVHGDVSLGGIEIKYV
jgi:predicted membrane protein